MIQIKGKIIRILSPTQVVIDKGFVDGVRSEMEFVIYEEGEPLADPDTNEVLERIEVIKGRIYILHVQERVSVATTMPPHSGNGVLKIYAPNDPLHPEPAPDSMHRLNIDPGHLEPPARSEVSVKKGDRVRNIYG